MTRSLILALLAVVAVGCCSVDPCSDPIEVPAPYWNPPENIPSLDPPPILLVPTYQCVAEDQLMCVESTMEVITRDFLILLADSEQCRFQYGELVRFIESVPRVSPPPPSDTPPLE
jgi:hypothetical protein